MVKPLGAYIVIENVVVGEKTTKAGLLVPSTVTQKQLPYHGLVIAKGDLVTRVKSGDEVLFKPYASIDVAVDEKKLTIVEEDDILAVIKK